MTAATEINWGPVWDMLVAHFGSQSKIAEHVKTRQSTVSYRIANNLPPVAEWVPVLEEASGGAITRAAMRADLW